MTHAAGFVCRGEARNVLKSGARKAANPTTYCRVSPPATSDRNAAPPPHYKIITLDATQ
jgi:hypothetical protein